MNTTTNTNTPHGSSKASTVTMRAIVQDRYGSSDTWKLTDIGRPEINDHEVLVRVHAAGLDRGTWHEMTGRPYLMRIMGFGLRSPKNRVPGRAVAGRVAAVGAGVTRFTVGDEIFGVSRGAFAEYAAAREDKLAHKPSILTFEQAAAVPISATTALQGLRLGRIEAGQEVLIIGASGGVGSYAVQLAKAFGAQVTGVCSAAKADFVRSLGADRTIDYASRGVRRRIPPLRPDPRRRRQHHTPTPPALPRIDGQPRHRRRREQGQPDRRLREEPASTTDVAVRASSTDHARVEGTSCRPGAIDRTHRGGQGRAEHRSDLLTRPSARRDAPTRGRHSSGQGFHHDLTDHPASQTHADSGDQESDVVT